MCFWRLCHKKNNAPYPKVILPNIKYIKKINIDDLLDNVEGFIVSRRITGRLEENVDVFAGKKRLRVEALGNIPNLSLNLLGGKFVDKRHLKFRQLHDASREWDGLPVLLHNYADKYEVINNCFSVVYRGKDLHNISIPYKKEIKNKVEKDKLQKLGIDLAKFTDGELTSLQGKIQLEHKPTMLNYWHFVMDIFPQEENSPLKKTNAAWQKSLVQYVIEEILISKFEINPRLVPKICDSLYKNKKEAIIRRCSC